MRKHQEQSSNSDCVEILSCVTRLLCFCVQIFLSCLSTGFVFIILSAFVRGLAEQAPSFNGTDPQVTQALLSIPPNTDWTHILVVLAVTALVTGARVGLLKVWPDFADATDKSNRQVSGFLAPVAFLPSLLAGCLINLPLCS